MIKNTVARTPETLDDCIDAENRVAYLIFMYFKYCDKPETLERQIELLIGSTDVRYVED